MRAIIVLCLLCSVARADTGPYVSWSLTGWFPTGKLAAAMRSSDNGAQFALIVGARFGHHVALEAFTAPAMNHAEDPAIDVEGVDAKLMWPLGRYVTPYVRLRLARMTVDLDPIGTRDAKLSGLGGGEGVGLQVQFPGRMFGLIIPAWFAAPFGLKGIGGIWTEVSHEVYGLSAGGSRAGSEPFWRYAYGVAWGAAF